MATTIATRYFTLPDTYAILHVSRCCLRMAFTLVNLGHVGERFLVLDRTVTSVKVTVFWNVASCSLTDTNRRFRGAYYHHYQGYQTARRNIPKSHSSSCSLPIAQTGRYTQLYHDKVIIKRHKFRPVLSER